MRWSGRQWFPLAALGLLVGALAWAISFGTLPPADFTFVNEGEIQSVDPAIVTGTPEGRIIDAILQGLYQFDPETLSPIPGVAAELPQISSDGRTYHIKLRKTARWSDDVDEQGNAKEPSPVTAHDFYWSWQRFLFPGTAAQYSYQLWYVKNAKNYTTGEMGDDNLIEVELPDRPDDSQPFPRGTILHGTLERLEKPPEPPAPSDEADDDKRKRLDEWRTRWVYHVKIDGQVRRFAKEPADDSVEKCAFVLIDFRTVGLRVINDYELEIELNDPTPFFTHLLSFYPLHPVNRKCVETHGYPAWTKPENFIGNGPYRMQFRRLRDRIRLVKSQTYWDADNVQLNTIDALAVSSRTTALNMYLTGEVDWITAVSGPVIPMIQYREDFRTGPQMTTYIYRLNVTRPPLDNVLVRRALNLAMDKRDICESLLKAGEQPARSFVPPGMVGYTPSLCDEYNPAKARELLAEAGFPDGRGIPTIEILYNTDERHERIAEMIQSQWKRNLGINTRLRNQEFGVQRATVRKMQYTVSRMAWTGDYPDPNTYLDMFVTGGENNETGWGNPEYDRLIAGAATQNDPAHRMETLRQAERILMDEMPLIPMYFYVSKNLLRPYVKGFHDNLQDRHPLHRMSIDPQEKARILAAEGR